MFQKCLSTQRGTKGGGQKKMHSSAIYKGYALYKIDGKNTLQQQNSVVSICRKCPLRIPFITIQRDATYFFIVFFLSMYTILFFLYACFWDSLLLFLYTFHFSPAHN